MEKESHITYLFHHDALLSLKRSIIQSVNRNGLSQRIHTVKTRE